MTTPLAEEARDTVPLLAPSLARRWGWLLALGIVWIIGGTLALILPIAATLAFGIVFGVVLLVGGIAQLVHALGHRDWQGVTWHLIGGVLALVVGVLILVFPWQGVFSLTVLVGIFFLLAGAARTAFAFANRGRRGWGWILASGLLTLALGVLILAALPGAASWVLGVLVGIELLFTGWWMVMTALLARRWQTAG